MIIGSLLFIGFAIAFAPASLVPKLLEQSAANTGSAVTLLNPRGTLWRGSGQVHAQGSALGVMHWQLTPSSLLSAKAGADVQVALADPSSNNSGGNLTGQIAANQSAADVALAGTLTGSWVSQFLAEYEVTLGGEFTTDKIAAALDPQAALQTLAADGELAWSGGLVSYRLGNTLARQRLEPMNAVISGNMQDAQGVIAQVYGQESYPLLELAMLPNGLVKVSITQRLTQIVGSPWPGSDPDHEFVLVVEQAVF